MSPLGLREICALYSAHRSSRKSRPSAWRRAMAALRTWRTSLHRKP